MAPHLTSSPSPPQNSHLSSSSINFNLTLIDDKPVPRPPKSQADTQRIRIQNRRREYLEKHPEYFDSVEHELVDPILYDTLIRQFQSPEERQSESNKKGYARVLESSLLRGEKRLARLRDESENQNQTDSNAKQPGSDETRRRVEFTEEIPTTRQEGQNQWIQFLRERFIKGLDEEFDYVGLVDEKEEYDILAEKEREEEWFEGESPSWVGDDEDGDHVVVERVLKGETGVQDF